MRPPRQLSPDEAALWRRLAATVRPLERRKGTPIAAIEVFLPVASPVPAKVQPKVVAQSAPMAARREPPRAVDGKVGLDSTWERKIARGVLEPDFSLDLHGSGLDHAYERLMHGLSQARAMGARVVLVVTGKPRPTEAADRGNARGAIRAKIVDWLGASEHASSIAAIRSAHRRHGGQGAIYVVLKKR